MILEKINDSFIKLTANEEIIDIMNNTFTIYDESQRYLPAVVAGFVDPTKSFAKINPENPRELFTYYGFHDIITNSLKGIKTFVEKSDFTIEDINEHFEEVCKKLPFVPYDFQKNAYVEAILNGRQILKCCTGSGKSLIISLFLDFMRRHNKRCILIVPSISLLSQFADDIKSYNLEELYNGIQILGGDYENVKTLEWKTQLLISTWQSLSKLKNINEVDCIIYDEGHRSSADVSADMITKFTSCPVKLAFTGTIPENDVNRLTMIALFGKINNYITARDLISRGLGTPIEIISVFLNHNKDTASKINSCDLYSQKLKVLKGCQQRSKFITKISNSAINDGNTLVLFSHTEHGYDIFKNIMKERYPNVVVKQKDITGKKALEFQKKYNIFFLNGSASDSVREEVRKLLNTPTEDGSYKMIVGNVALCSTGINIPSLKYLILASPFKAYTTVTQSIGRLIRLSKFKNVSIVYDIVDLFPLNGLYGGTFFEQYKHRVSTSYDPEGYKINKLRFDIDSL